MTLTTTVMVMETTGALQLIVPLMITVFVAKVRILPCQDIRSCMIQEKASSGCTLKGEVSATAMKCATLCWYCGICCLASSENRVGLPLRSHSCWPVQTLITRVLRRWLETSLGWG